MARFVFMKKLFKHFFALSIVSFLTFVVASCSSASNYPNFSAADSVEMYDLGVVEEAVAQFENDSSFNTEINDAAIIKTGSLRLQVKDQEAALNEVLKTVTSIGGSVENRYIYRNSEGVPTSTEMQLKIPSAKFDEAFEKLNTIGVVIEDQRSETDVSLERADLQARVGALQTSIERLTKLMETSDNVSALLEAETVLSERQQQLDSLQSQLSVLEDQISYSRIWLTLSVNEIVPGGPNSFWDGIVLGFKSLVNFVSTSLIAFGVAVPWLITLGVIATVIIVIIKLLTRKKPQK